MLKASPPAVKSPPQAVKSPPPGVSSYVGALGQFWWLLVIGVAIAAVAALASFYRIDVSSLPPNLEKREELTYTASARLLVTSAEAPYFRTTVTQEVVGPDGEVQTFSNAPELTTLISTANLYPILIESDEVRQLRDEMAGPLPGAIATRAIYEVNSPSRFELSQVPVVEVFGMADTAAGAMKLAQATVSAFMVYVDRAQDNANLDRQQRVLLKEIQRPVGAIASGGTSLSLPLMIFLIITAAFVALAILLSRLFPAGLGLGDRLPTWGARDTDVKEPTPELEPKARRSKAPV